MKFYYLSETILSTVQIYIIFLIQVTVLPDFLINRFLFQPVLKIELGRDVWNNVLDTLIALYLLWGVYRERKRHENVNSQGG